MLTLANVDEMSNVAPKNAPIATAEAVKRERLRHRESTDDA